MILLDTDTLTLFFAGHDNVVRRVNQSDDEVAISVVTRIEVLQGRFDYLLKATDGTQLLRAMTRLAQTERDLGRLEVVPFDDSAAREFDQLRPNRKLKKIGRADLLIACIALAQNATLVTRNVRHFQHVPGLRTENWAD